MTPNVNIDLDWQQGVMDWFQIILRERLHCDLLLSQGPEGLYLSFAGNPRRVWMNRMRSVFDCSGSAQVMGWWDAASEGWVPPLGKSLPAPGNATLQSPLVVQEGADFRLHFDVLGLTFWMLSRREEVDAGIYDEHGRFPATASHAYIHHYLERPVVDEWFSILGQIIQRQWPGLALRERNYEVCPSHDVDRPSRYAFRSAGGLMRGLAGDLFRNRRWRDAVQAPWIRWSSGATLHPKDPYNTFDWIMELSEQSDVRSTFFMKAGRTHLLYDDPYDLRHPAIRQLLRKIDARGHRIGIHPSYETWRNPEVLRHEVVTLQRCCDDEGIAQVIEDVRMHYLRWTHPETLRNIARIGLKSDNTLGFGAHPGFRCGTCHSYPAIDPIVGEILPVTIRPMVLMDAALTKAQGQYAGEGAAAERIRSLSDACRAVGGQFSILWHNSELWRTDWQQLYKSAFAR